MVPSDFTTISFGLFRRLSLNLSARTVRVPSSATRDTQRPPCSAARRRPWRSRVSPFDFPVAWVVNSGPSGSRRQRAMRLFGMSLKKSAPPRQIGPSVKPRPPAMRSITASAATRSFRPGLRTSRVMIASSLLLHDGSYTADSCELRATSYKFPATAPRGSWLARLMARGPRLATGRYVGFAHQQAARRQDNRIREEHGGDTECRAFPAQ